MEQKTEEIRSLKEFCRVVKISQPAKFAGCEFSQPAKFAGCEFSQPASSYVLFDPRLTTFFFYLFPKLPLYVLLVVHVFL